VTSNNLFFYISSYFLTCTHPFIPILLTAARPPEDISPTSEIFPTLEPTSTNPASGGDTIPVTLNIFAIDYSLSESAAMPVRDDFLALEGVTADYFEQYMRDTYEESSQSTLVEFQTFLVTSILT
jgi:hypothetical protein